LNLFPVFLSNKSTTTTTTTSSSSSRVVLLVVGAVELGRSMAITGATEKIIVTVAIAVDGR